jgi:hypothetical protein
MANEPRDGPDPCETAPFSLDRAFWLALLLAAVIVIPRSVLIAHAHSESYDDGCHLTSGIAFLMKQEVTDESYIQLLNDPPLGKALVALPKLAARLCGVDKAGPWNRAYPASPDSLAMLTAAWKAMLFLPMVGVAFQWCRRLYGLRSAWLAAVLLVIEPNFAAHIPIPALDVLATEAIFIACFLAWRYFETPSSGRLAALAVALAAALLIKHTAIILPMVMLAMAVAWWCVKPWRDGQSFAEWRGLLPGRRQAMARMILMAMASLWALTLFNVSVPVTGSDLAVPAGIYLKSFLLALAHASTGHENYLNGEVSWTGWWYYFPVVATYKVPIGVWVLIALAVVSLRRTRPSWGELGLFLPMAAWTLLMMKTRINIGFRHFLTPYAFMLALSARCLARPCAWGTAAAWAAVAAAGFHAATFHPDYLCYINAPRHKPYLAISDSNVDWGQSLKQVRRWIEGRSPDGRPIYLRYFGTADVGHYLGDRVILLGADDPPPTGGLLIISPVYEAGLYDKRQVYAELRSREPVAVIGHCMQVYDLDRLGAGEPFVWKLAVPPVFPDGLTFDPVAADDDRRLEASR